MTVLEEKIRDMIPQEFKYLNRELFPDDQEYEESSVMLQLAAEVGGCSSEVTEMMGGIFSSLSHYTHDISVLVLGTLAAGNRTPTTSETYRKMPVSHNESRVLLTVFAAAKEWNLERLDERYRISKRYTEEESLPAAILAVTGMYRHAKQGDVIDYFCSLPEHRQYKKNSALLTFGGIVGGKTKEEMLAMFDDERIGHYGCAALLAAAAASNLVPFSFELCADTHKVLRGYYKHNAKAFATLMALYRLKKMVETDSKPEAVTSSVPQQIAS